MVTHSAVTSEQISASEGPAGSPCRVPLGFLPSFLNGQRKAPKLATGPPAHTGLRWPEPWAKPIAFFPVPQPSVSQSQHFSVPVPHPVGPHSPRSTPHVSNPGVPSPHLSFPWLPASCTMKPQLLFSASTALYNRAPLCLQVQIPVSQRIPHASSSITRPRSRRLGTP